MAINNNLSSDTIKSSINIQQAINSSINSNSGQINEQIVNINAPNVELDSVDNIHSSNLRNDINIKSDFINPLVTGYGYVHFAYSETYPTSDSDITFIPNENTYYLGVYSGDQADHPRSYTNYVWMKMRGEDGADGEPGPVGEQGPKGDSGETTLTIVNPLYFTGRLNPESWQADYLTRGAVYYYQKIDITNEQLISTTLTEQELIDYMNIKANDTTTPVADLVVSNTNVVLGLSQIEQWSYLSRVYISKEIYEDESVSYFVNFECYDKVPTIQLLYQIKVI